MILITSGALISSELQVELGKLPPAFLPVGNRRLFEHQASAARSSFPDESIYLSITDAYDISDGDLHALAELGIQVVPVPEGLSLGESILFSINSIGDYDSVLRVLHGDTLIRHFPAGNDVIGLSESHDLYAWEHEPHRGGEANIWNGYFSFANIKSFAQLLTASRGQFVKAVRSYSQLHRSKFSTTTDWFDLGHVNTYFQSRSRITTERTFNNLKISNGIVTKSSSETEKIFAEAAWFEGIPTALRKFTPQFLGKGENSCDAYYQLEYLPLLPLNELFVHGNLPIHYWRQIHRLVLQVLDEMHIAGTDTSDRDAELKRNFETIVTTKTINRIRAYEKREGAWNQAITLNGREQPSLSYIVSQCQTATLCLPQINGVSHGDFCFSNLLYNSRINSLKLIDPRGLNAENKPTIFGDLKYDLAKYLHSTIGGYDHIIAGRYIVEKQSDRQYSLQINMENAAAQFSSELLTAKIWTEIRTIDLLPLVVLLFVSMVPLHQDDPRRCEALFLNAHRLYNIWEDLSK